MSRPTPMAFGRYDFAAYQSFVAYAGASVVIPVALVALSRDLGFSLEEGGMSSGGALQLGRTLLMCIAMVLGGFVAGRWGKRRSMGVSVALMGLGVLLASVAPMYGVLFLALMIAGLGEGVLEGLLTPFVRDLHPKEPGRYINFTHSFWSVGVLLTVLVSGTLISAGVSWRLVVAGVGMLAFAAALALLLPEKKGREYPEHPEPIHWRTTWEHARQIARIPRFWVFFAAMFVAGGGEFGLTFWVASYIQLNFVDAAWAGGVGTALFAGGMIVGRIGGGYIVRQHQLRPLVVGSAVAGTVVTLSIPWIARLEILFFVLFLAGLASAPYWPSVQSYSADRMPRSDTTMLLILLSCAGVPGCGILTWAMGMVGDLAGLRVAFYLVPACYLFLAILIAWEGRRPAEV
ncbi:MAG: MFS transporter [Fimbriimonadaceae bacterium]